jgi:RES domain-containing protein
VILWRISNYTDISGNGGLQASGRWHTQGRKVVYCTTDPGIALLEVLVHLEVDPEDLPQGFRWLKIAVPETVTRETVAALPEGWRTDSGITRARGDAWLRQGSSALLFIPNAIVPEGQNVLLNPQAATAEQCRVSAVMDYPLDPRLLASTGKS